MDLLQYLHNYISVDVDSDGFLVCHRFLNSQLAAYQYNPMYRYMSKNAAGVCLRFSTQARRISFVCKIDSPQEMEHQALEATTPYQTFEEEQKTKRTPAFVPGSDGNRLGTQEPYGAYFDCCVNGTLIASKPAESTVIEFELPDPGEELAEVAVYFPHLVVVWIKDLSADQPLYPIMENPKILFLGDSITQGLNVVHPSRCHTVQLAQKLHCDWVNQGVAGYVFQVNSLTGLENLPFTPKKVIVAFGTNDWEFGGGKEQIQHSVSQYFERLAKIFPTTDIVVITPWWRADEGIPTVNGTLSDWRKDIISTAQKLPNVVIIKGDEVSPHDIGYLQDGFLHPNDAGADWITEQIFQILS